MQTHHVVRQHVQINQIIHTIQVMHQVIVVSGHVMIDIQRVEIVV